MAYLQALSGAETWSISATGELTLSGSKGSVLPQARDPRRGKARAAGAGCRYSAERASRALLPIERWSRACSAPGRARSARGAAGRC
jgi:hypothetical protein